MLWRCQLWFKTTTKKSPHYHCAYWVITESSLSRLIRWSTAVDGWQECLLWCDKNAFGHQPVPQVINSREIFYRKITSCSGNAVFHENSPSVCAREDSKMILCLVAEQLEGACGDCFSRDTDFQNIDKIIWFMQLDLVLSNITVFELLNFSVQPWIY